MATIRHILALDIPDTACDTILRVWDASVYAQGLDVDCPRLDIWLPGFVVPKYYTDLQANFVKNLNAIDLGLQHPLSDTPVTLPDGLYKIRYSVSPNDKVFVEYHHLRTTNIVNMYYQEMCKVQLEPCEPDTEQHQKLHDLRYIKMYIDAAKAKAEYCHAPEQAVDMLAYAEKLLRKYLTGCCVSCTNNGTQFFIGNGPMSGHSH
jgi:hypothetical protein